MKSLFALFLVVCSLGFSVEALAQTKAPSPTPKPSPKDMLDMSDLGDYLGPLKEKSDAWDILKVPQLMEERKYDDAIVIFNGYLKKGGPNAFIFSYRALAYYYKKDSDKALNDVTASLKKDPAEVRAIYVRALIEKDRGQNDASKKDFDLAIDISNNAIKTTPGLTDAYFTRAETYRLMGENAKAAADYRKTLELSSGYPLAAEHLKLVAGVRQPPIVDDETAFKAHAKEFEHLAPLLEEAGDKADAYENALKFDNKKNNRNAFYRAADDNSICKALADYDALYDLASAESIEMSDLVESGRIDSKSDLAVKASDAADTMAGLGGDILTRQLIWKCLAQKTGATAVPPPAVTDLKTETKPATEKVDYDLALRSMNGLLAKDSKDVKALALRGDIYLAQKKTELARADYSQAIKLSPSTSAYYYQRGMSFLASPGFSTPAAMADLTKAIELNNNNADAHKQRGLLYIADLKFAEAKADLLSVAAGNPNDSVTNYHLGRIYVKENNADQAINYFTRSIKAEPKFPYAYVERGQVYEFLKKNDEALADYTQTIKLLPDSSIGYTYRSALYFKLEKYPLAVADVTKNISFPDRASGDYMRRALMYEGWGKYDEALADLQSAIGLAPNDAWLKKHYNELVPTVNAARATAKEMSVPYKAAFDIYDPIEADLAAKIDIYIALKKSKEATPAVGKSPVCAQIPILTALTTKAITAFAPLKQLYDQGKLKGSSDQIDFVDDRIHKLDNTQKMLEHDKKVFSCQPVYYVE
ncbi:MAG: tetratricopeptide repeat protein [Acidobacteriota bacterium]